jgi:hypothetical protein
LRLALICLAQTGHSRLTVSAEEVHRFMFAAVGRRWTLRQVRWWGGWAEGEHVGVYSLHPAATNFLGSATHS